MLEVCFPRVICFRIWKKINECHHFCYHLLCKVLYLLIDRYIYRYIFQHPYIADHFFLCVYLQTSLLTASASPPSFGSLPCMVRWTVCLHSRWNCTCVYLQANQEPVFRSTYLFFVSGVCSRVQVHCHVAKKLWTMRPKWTQKHWAFESTLTLPTVLSKHDGPM